MRKGADFPFSMENGLFPFKKIKLRLLPKKEKGWKFYGSIPFPIPNKRRFLNNRFVFF